MRRYKKHENAEEINYWESYSDMMAALLLLFALIMAFALLQYLKSYEEKLKDQEVRYKEQISQAKQLEELQTQLNEQQNQIHHLVGIKSKIIEELKGEFESTKLDISIDEQTGAIIMDSSILFDYNDYSIKDSGKKLLRDFLPIYMEVVLKDDFKDYLSEIIIEGHSDTEGDYTYNLDLSQKRAFIVAEFCSSGKEIELGEKQLTQLRKILTANGRAWSNPVYNENGKINMDKSRRVEIKFRLKNDEMIQEMKKILEEN